jgi:hypothetical protein
MAATIYLKRDGIWTVSVMTEPATLTMPEIEVDVPLSAIYAEVELPPQDATDS